jgi:hypothetical protein
MSKWGFGVDSFIVKTNAFLPGIQTEMFGPRYVAPGKFQETYATYQYEFGEIVEIVEDKGGVYLVKPITTETTNAGKFAVIMRDIAGAESIKDVRVDEMLPNVTLSLFLLDNVNRGTISVFLDSTATVTIGNSIHVGKGTGTTKAGAVYPAAVSTDTINLTNVVFKTVAMEPTNTSAKSVVIGIK